MAVSKSKNFAFVMLFSLFFAVLLALQGVAASRSTPVAVSSDTIRSRTFSSVDLQINFPRGEGRMRRELKREMIGSVAPTCTYNECRGCKYKCRAEQVPVEGNDPMNSPYHYKCVCHR